MLILTDNCPLLLSSPAEELEIPILSVDLDTLTTVVVDRTFGQVRLHEPIKVQCILRLMAKHFDVDRLLSQLIKCSSGIAIIKGVRGQGQGSELEQNLRATIF